MKLTTTSPDAGVLGDAMEVLGPYATLLDDARWPSNGRWVKQYLGDRSMTIAGGTSEVQRTIVARRILGLPRDRAERARRSADRATPVRIGRC